MAETKKLTWDQVGERAFETGVEKGVVYPAVNGEYPKGAAWNGLIGISQSPSGAESTPLYANNKKYLNLMSDEQFGFSISAYTYPDEFAACDGSAQLAKGVKVGQQPRNSFGMSYVTKNGNDTNGAENGYTIHLVYGATASPSSKDYKTTNDSVEAMELSWEATCVPVEVPGMKKPSAHIEIESKKVTPEQLKSLEDMLYGTESAEARLPLPTELVTIFRANAA